MSYTQVKNIFGEAKRVPIILFAKQTWESKSYTLDCGKCSFCIRQAETMIVLRMVNKNKGASQWLMPSPEFVKGACVVGEWPKVLSPSQRLFHCQYFKEENKEG